MSLLITGGAGFIGSNFIYQFLKNHPKERVVCLDKLTYAGNLLTLEPLFSHPNFRFIQGDICNRRVVEKVFKEERPDVVVNFAAESHVDRSIKNPNIFLKTNVVGVQVLLNACLKFGVKRFHQVSTDEVYGDTSLKSRRKFSEKDHLKPSSPYSASKAAADLLVLSYYKTYGLPVTVSRSGNNYGPYQHPEKFIPHMIEKALNGEDLPIYGTGKNIRDWIYVNDHCRAIDLILEKGEIGQIYNVGAGEEKANLEIVRILSDHLSIYAPKIRIRYVEDRKGHDLRYSLNTEKINLLGWQPQVSFFDGVKTTVNWYLEHSEWVKSCLRNINL